MTTESGLTVGIASLWHDTPELLPIFVELMVRAPEWDVLWLVANGCSQDSLTTYMGALGYIQELTRPNVGLLRMKENSVLHGWNAGMEKLGTDVVISMASDVALVHPNWLAWATEGIAPGIIQGPITQWRPPILYVDGCCAVYMRSDWERLGGLDAETYEHPGYWSDVDIAWRAMQMGITVRQTVSGIRHLVNYTAARTLTPEQWKLMDVNRDRLLQRMNGTHKKVLADELR